MFFFLEAIKGLNFNCRIVSYCKNQKKMHSPPFIFSRFQCGKQIHALKYLVLAGGKGSFLLIKNKLPRALRSPLFSLRLPRLPGAPDRPWNPGGHCRPCEASPPLRTLQSLSGRGPISLRLGLPKHLFLFKKGHQY